MDGANIYRASHSIRQSGRSSRERMGSMRGSMRTGSTSIWRDQGMDVFSKSTREEDDEEALKWASLEKLPTFDRLRKGLLLGSQGADEVDIDDLGMQQRKNLLERLVKVAEEDNEKFLMKLRDRIDRYFFFLDLMRIARHNSLETPAEPGRCSMAKMDIIMRAEQVRKDIVISISSFTQTVEQFKDIVSTVYQ